MKQTEIQKVLLAVYDDPGIKIDQIVHGTELGAVVVELILDKLEDARLIFEGDDDGTYGVTQFGDEVLMARSADKA